MHAQMNTHSLSKSMRLIPYVGSNSYWQHKLAKTDYVIIMLITQRWTLHDMINLLIPFVNTNLQVTYLSASNLKMKAK